MPERAQRSVDSARLLPRFRGEVVSTVRARVVLEVVEPVTTSKAYAVAGGDRARLRGIPAIGHGVSGHIGGTQPEQAVCEDDASTA